ncbi:MAG: hypothetical protein R3B67_07910 [Phycisphaerales bacterium]
MTRHLAIGRCDLPLDPDAAEHHAKINEVVDMEMLFVGVPVVVTGEQNSEFNGMNPSELLTPAQETDEGTQRETDRSVRFEGCRQG